MKRVRGDTKRLLLSRFKILFISQNSITYNNQDIISFYDK